MPVHNMVHAVCFLIMLIAQPSYRKKQPKTQNVPTIVYESHHELIKTWDPPNFPQKAVIYRLPPA